MKKRITYIVSEINKSVFFEQTAILLKQDGIDLSFILINSTGGMLDNFLQVNHFNIRRLTVKKIHRSFWAILKCRRHLKELNPDIIHCHLTSANTVGLIAGFMAGIKNRIYTRHAGLLLHGSKKERLLDFLHNSLAKKIVAITINVKEILLSQGVAEDKIALIHHGFDIKRMMHPDAEELTRITNSYNMGKQYPVIGVVARWLEWKGIQYIIPAFEKLLLKYPAARLCLFNGDETTAYGMKIKKMLAGINPENYITPSFEYNVYDLFLLFDVYVHVPVNKTCEAFGQTYIEALAAGIPSIFTLSGVATEFITDQENALVVDYKDTNAVYDSLIELIQNKEKQLHLKENGKLSVVNKFSLETYIEKLKALYMQY